MKRKTELSRNEVEFLSTEYYELIRAYRPKDEMDRRVKENMLSFITVHGDTVLTRENPIAHMTASTVIVNEERTRMLMIHHKIYDTWTWQGGHTDGEKDLLKVALKEAEEETGIRTYKVLENEEGIIRKLDILTVKAHMKNGEPIAAHLHLNAAFLLEAKEEDALLLNKEETNGIRWVPLEEIDALAKEPEITPIYHELIRRGK